MGTTKPRITITLDHGAYDALRELSEACGEPMSSIVAQVVEMASPTWRRVAKMMVKARAAPAEAQAGMLAALERAESQVASALEAATITAHGAVSSAVEVPPRLRREGRASVPPGVGSGGLEAAPTPVPVTRGSGRSTARRSAGKPASVKGA